MPGQRGARRRVEGGWAGLRTADLLTVIPTPGGPISREWALSCNVRRWVPAYAGMTVLGGRRTVGLSLTSHVKQTSAFRVQPFLGDTSPAARYLQQRQLSPVGSHGAQPRTKGLTVRPAAVRSKGIRRSGWQIAHSSQSRPNATALAGPAESDCCWMSAFSDNEEGTKQPQLVVSAPAAWACTLKQVHRTPGTPRGITPVACRPASPPPSPPPR